MKAELGVPDMTRISDMDEVGINKNLQTRFERGEIYTYTGPILVAVNPYRELDIYHTQNVFRYHGMKLGALEPHVFALAESAYTHLQTENTNQSLVISGESGAGKTENTKFILEYLCRVTANISTWVQQQILEANGILEAFGNAKTIRNDNSSRFGRFMQVCFDSGFKIAGCVIQDYLLEQSRIIHQAPGERNYHIFYQLLAAASRDKALAEQFQVSGEPSSYQYLKQSGCTTLDGVDDADKFDALRLALEIVQIPKESSDSLFCVLSSVLWLGNLQYRGENNDECLSDAAALTSEDETVMHTIASLLAIPYDELVQVALFRQIIISGNVTNIPLKLQEAREHRHGMAKALYSRIFAWLVDHINKCTNPGKEETMFIGILDIFGFENFDSNSFEQLCINYTNEKLHMFFNHYVFKIEQETYKEEEIKFSHITFTDNTRCLELIDKPPRCILKLLSEQCHMPQGKDMAYLSNLHAEFEKHPDYVKGDDRRKWDKEFGVRHYAGTVLYRVEGFVAKNRDSQQDVFFDVLSRSGAKFVQELYEFKDLLSKVAQLGDVKGDSSFSKGTVKRMTNRAKPTVSDAFRLQLQVLVQVLENTNPWYVRCIKPNTNKSAAMYDVALVQDQLRYLGMLEIIRIKKQGFPVHYPFREFKSRYVVLNIKNRFRVPKDEKDGVRFILKAEGMQSTEWQIGKTKVFLRSSVHEPLEDRRRAILRQSAILIQSRWKTWTLRRRYLAKVAAARRIQEYYFSWKYRFRFIKERRAAIVIQAHLRGMFAREVATALREARRVEEERRRQERLQQERKIREEEKAREQESEDKYLSFSGLADMDGSGAEEEINKLTQLADKINHQISTEEPQTAGHVTNVDLDQLFNFLSSEVTEGSVKSESVRSSSVTPRDGDQDRSEKSSILDEIDKQMADLQQEMDRYSLQESIGADNEETETSDGGPPSDSITDPVITPPPPPETFQREFSYSPPPLPPPEHQTPHLNLQKPSLPEPEGPPPPPPIQNGYAFTGAAHYDHEAQKAMDTLKRQKSKPKEPIYESIKPRPEPVGGSGNSPPASEYKVYTPHHPEIAPASPLPLLPAPDQGGDSEYGFGENRLLPPPPPPAENDIYGSRPSQPEGGESDIYGKTVMPDEPYKPTRRRSSSGSSTPGKRVSQPTQVCIDAEEQQREQRKLLRVRRELERIQEVEEEREARKEEHHSILEFAENFFNEHEKTPSGTIVGTIKRSKTLDKLGKDEMVSFYKGSSIPTSHIHMFDPENVSLAVNIFKELNKYARAEHKGEAEISVIQQIIQLGIEREELRDEIFVQIMRQLTNNPNLDQVEKLWLLLCLVVVAFPASKALFKYFVSFLQINNRCELGKVHQYVQWCLDNSSRNQFLARRLPPSSVEIAAMKRLGTIVCRFFFLDGRTKAIDVHPCDTAQDSVGKLAEKIGLQNVEGWALYESGPAREAHITAHHYLYDVISSWELEQIQDKSSLQSKSYSPVKAQPKKIAAASSDNRFIFKRRTFKNNREIPSDLVEVSLLYAQAVHSVVRCDELPVSEKVALQLAGLQAQVGLGDPQRDKGELYAEVDMFLPHRIKSARFNADPEWIPILMEAHAHYGSGKSDMEAKVWYLRCVMQYPLYGNTQFPVVYRGFWSHGNDLVLAINALGLILLRPEESRDATFLFQFPYRDIETILLDPSENCVTITLKKESSPAPEPAGGEKQRVFVLETGSKAEIGALVASYHPALNNAIREADAPFRKVKQITNEDRQRLSNQLVNCRRALIESNLLRKPVDDGKGFIKNTLRKLSAKKLEKLRAEALTNEQGEVYKGYTHTFWAFCKAMLGQTLSIMTEQDEAAALQIFNLILTYAGLILVTKEENSPATAAAAGVRAKDEDDSHVVLIQTVLDRAMRKDCLVNEVFLQLIKQTTDHPEPNSRVNLRHWSLLALACSIILPVDKMVRKYLLAHLKKCSADFVTEEGKYARFAEKCFHKTLGTRRRQWPPSKQEILCTINRRSIYARFHFMDGQFHTVEFDPSSTAAEVLNLVINKIGLREGAGGYAIYEVLGQQERSLLPDEKVADVMSKWDKYRAAGGTLSRQSRHHMFLFKKHLFLDEYIDLRDPVEKELLYYQVLCDLRSDRFPVTDMEAVMLCALRAQIELTDFSGEGDYRQVMSHCLPPRLLVNLQKDHVSMHHQSLLGMSVEEAKQAFLNLIQCWPLHRATLFDVNQTFTSNWPRNLWLGVDQRGVHLLEAKTRNVLTSYEFETVMDYTPSINHLLFITGNDKKQSKVILNTSQAFQISNLIREYTEVLQARQL